LKRIIPMFIAVVLLLSVSVLALGEDINTKVSLQGRLTDQNGIPINDVKTFDLDINCGGDSWSDSYTAQVEDGLFTILMNTGNLDFDDSCYLSVTVDGESLGSVEVASAPTAYRADEVGQLTEDLQFLNGKGIMSGVFGSIATIWKFGSAYPNFGIFYTEGSPDYISFSPNGGGDTDPVLKIKGDGSLDMNDNPINNIYSISCSQVGGCVDSADILPNQIGDTQLFNGGTWNINSPLIIDNSANGQIVSFKGGADDTNYEWVGFYSGDSRKGIMIWDGDWDSCSSNSGFCIKSENGMQLRLKSDNGNVRILDELTVDGSLYLNDNLDINFNDIERVGNIYMVTGKLSAGTGGIDMNGNSITETSYITTNDIRMGNVQTQHEFLNLRLSGGTYPVNIIFNKGTSSSYGPQYSFSIRNVYGGIVLDGTDYYFESFGTLYRFDIEQCISLGLCDAV